MQSKNLKIRQYYTVWLRVLILVPCHRQVTKNTYSKFERDKTKALWAMGSQKPPENSENSQTAPVVRIQHKIPHKRFVFGRDRKRLFRRSRVHASFQWSPSLYVKVCLFDNSASDLRWRRWANSARTPVKPPQLSENFWIILARKFSFKFMHVKGPKKVPRPTKRIIIIIIIIIRNGAITIGPSPTELRSGLGP